MKRESSSYPIRNFWSKFKSRIRNLENNLLEVSGNYHQSFAVIGFTALILFGLVVYHNMFSMTKYEVPWGSSLQADIPSRLKSVENSNRGIAKVDQNVNDEHYVVDYKLMEKKLEHDSDVDSYNEFVDFLLHEDSDSSKPMYFLPFADGQSNGTHSIGVNILEGEIPRSLHITSKQSELSNLIEGVYHLLMVDEDNSLPHLYHGRTIWKKGSQNMHLYFDHGKHEWIIKEDLEFENPKPLVSVQDNSPLPITHSSKENEKFSLSPNSSWKLLNLGSSDNEAAVLPASVIIREYKNDTLNNPMLLLNRVYYGLDEDYDGDPIFNEGIELDNIMVSDLDIQEFQDEAVKVHLPFWSFVDPEIYHTFNHLHQDYDHNKILDDPIEYVSGKLKLESSIPTSGEE